MAVLRVNCTYFEKIGERGVLRWWIDDKSFYYSCKHGKVWDTNLEACLPCTEAPNAAKIGPPAPRWIDHHAAALAARALTYGAKVYRWEF